LLDQSIILAERCFCQYIYGMAKSTYQWQFSDEILKRLNSQKIISIETFLPEFENTYAVIDQLIEDKYAVYSRDGKDIVITPHGESFVEMGGYERYLERERRRENYTDELHTSTLQTNESVRRVNSLFWATIVIAAAGAVTSWLQYFNDSATNNLLQQLQDKDSLIQLIQNRLSQKESVLIVDSLQINSLKYEIDSLRKKR
jgi:hypothetical protein